MRAAAIHQFHSGSAYGDAVTNSMIYTRGVLRSLGYKSEIFVEHLAPELAREIKHYSKYKPSANQILLIHHSMGHELTDWILNLPDVKILVYHNITPHEFFPENSPAREYSKLGREQLRLFKDKVLASICISEFNAKELMSLGFESVYVVPVLIDPEVVVRSPWASQIVDDNADIVTLLFVGRLVPNKCQHDVIEIYRDLTRMVEIQTQLVLIGQHNNDQYFSRIQSSIADYGLTDSVKMLGKVTNEELYAWYRASDIFVSMSEHEGFCVPLLECMAFDVPIVAYNSSNIPNTLGQAGILVDEKNHQEIAAIISLIIKNRDLRRFIVRGQRDRLASFSVPEIEKQLRQIFEDVGVDVSGTKQPGTAGHEEKWQIEGPFETSYSLAIVNRELAFALDKLGVGQVSLYPTEGHGDYQPDAQFVRAIPGLEKLYKQGRKGMLPNVLIRNLYPPRVVDMDGLMNILYYAWEESVFPLKWVESINRYVDGVFVTSSYVKKVFEDAGVHVPLRVIGNGADHILSSPRQHFRGNLGKTFKFLHISSCFPRKGVDVLLNAYTNEFTSDDPVSLVIKTFPNVHNTVEEQVEKIKSANAKCPDILVINEDIAPGFVKDLYLRCNTFVAPSRGEGFGLCMAEAMLLEVPVIVTGAGGHTDFCTEDTAWLIDYQFARAETHIGLDDSVWAEPNVQHLRKLMRKLYLTPKGKLLPKIEVAKQAIQSRYTWDACAQRVVTGVKDIEKAPFFDRNKIRLGWVSTWNTRCGIACYSHYLIDRMAGDIFDIRILASRMDTPLRPDSSNVFRCWDNNFNPDLDEIEEVVTSQGLDVVVFQFNFGFFNIKSFGELIRKLHNKGVKSIVTFHSTHDTNIAGAKASIGHISGDLKYADKLLVHQAEDLNRFKDFGLVDNVVFFPHGVLYNPGTDYLGLRRRLGIACKHVIASYGFLLPHKGIEQLIEAFGAIVDMCPDSLLLLVNAVYSNDASLQLKERCQDLIEDLRICEKVVMVNDFLDDEESLCLLGCADLVAFPYQKTNESASGAVKVGIASSRPIVCTPLPIFNDVKDIVHFTDGFTPVAIANKIKFLLNDTVPVGTRSDRQLEWIQGHSWDVLSARLGGIIRAIMMSH